MIIIKIRTASIRIVTIIHKFTQPLHSNNYPLYVLFDKLRQCTFSFIKLVFRVMCLKYELINHSHKQVLFVREVMNNTSPCQPAGFGYFRKTRFLIVHLHKNFKCVFQHFIPVSYHITYRFYIFQPRKYYFIPIQTTL